MRGVCGAEAASRLKRTMVHGVAHLATKPFDELSKRLEIDQQPFGLLPVSRTGCKRIRQTPLTICTIPARCGPALGKLQLLASPAELVFFLEQPLVEHRSRVGWNVRALQQIQVVVDVCARGILVHVCASGQSQSRSTRLGFNTQELLDLCQELAKLIGRKPLQGIVDLASGAFRIDGVVFGHWRTAKIKSKALSGTRQINKSTAAFAFSPDRTIPARTMISVIARARESNGAQDKLQAEHRLVQSVPAALLRQPSAKSWLPHR
ncbi:hypothetical protein AB7M49_004570 [Bradyrhizobium elkanii]